MAKPLSELTKQIKPEVVQAAKARAEHAHPIRTDDDYRMTLRKLSAYFDNEPEPNTPDGDRFEVLLTQVEAYEGKPDQACPR